MSYKYKPGEFVYNDGGRVAYGLTPIHKLRKDPCDCVIRALAIVLDEPYWSVKMLLKDMDRQAKSKFPQYRNDKWGDRRGWPEYCYGAILDHVGYRRVDANTTGITNVTDLLDKWSDGSPMFKGVYFCKVPHHVTVIIDGVMYDTDFPSNNRLYTYWHRSEIGHDGFGKEREKLGEL